jgi:hypothetical protein
VIHHNGGNTIFYADMGIVPDANLVIFLMTNVAADFGASGQLLSQIGRRLLAGEPLPPVPDVVAADATTLLARAGTYELEGGGALVVTARDAWLDIEALDPRAFSALFSSRPVDHERAARLTARIEEISTGVSAGDFEPLARAYRGEVTAAYLAGRWEQTLAALEESNGELRTQTVLGTALGLDRDVTLVRLEFADGEAHRAYVWDPQESEHLLGVSQRGLDHLLHVHPVAGGGWASWDARWGTSLPVEIVETDGAVRLTIHAGSDVIARRAPR